MIVFRRRLIFWLIKAYIKKSKKTLLFSFLFGLMIFFIFLLSGRYFTKLIPLTKKTTIGVVGDYHIEDVTLNGDFVQSLTIVSVKDKLDRKKFQFYSSEEALKTAYLLGEISEAGDITENKFKQIPFNTFANTVVRNTSNYSR